MLTEIIKLPSMREVLNTPEALDFIRKTLDEDSNMNKSRLSSILCEKYSFISPSGELQKSGCQVVLSSLVKANLITLPIKLKLKGKTKTVRQISRLGEEVPLPPEGFLPKSSELLGDDLVITFLEKEDHHLKLIWNEIMYTDHPQGKSVLVGYQLKYLVSFKGYYIGGLCFSSSSFGLSARDKWIGWSIEQQNQDRQHVLCMSRFLIRNGIRCDNLASTLLSKMLKRVGKDYMSRYKIDLWLVESFLDISLYKGTCYKASNWTSVGFTKGRGRNDRKHKNNAGVKEIYTYAIDKSFRKKILSSDRFVDVVKEKKKRVSRLNVMPPKKEVIYNPIDIEAGISSNEWADNEFGEAYLKTPCQVKNLIDIAYNKMRSPSSSYPQVVNGERKKMDAYYSHVCGYSKVIKKDKETGEKTIRKSSVSFDGTLEGHRNQTIRRIAAQKKVLVIQDSTDENYNTLKQTKGLGVIGSKKNGSVSLGVRIHSSFVTTVEGIPLGITKSQVDAPKVYSVEEKNKRKHLPIEDKESIKWVNHYKDTLEISELVGDTVLISLMDREGDIWEVYECADENRKQAPVIIRAKHNRVVKTENVDEKEKEKEKTRMFENVEKFKNNFEIDMRIPPQRARKKGQGKEARPYLPSRIAKLKVSYGEIEVLCPSDKKNTTNKKSIKLNFVSVIEENPPEGAEQICWRLLTTLEINNDDNALECILYYKERWKIEDWHRVLKSGCNIEKHKQNTLDNLKNVIAIDLVIGWRIMLLTLLGRSSPELAADLIFDEFELLTLSVVKKKKLKI